MDRIAMAKMRWKQ